MPSNKKYAMLLVAKEFTKSLKDGTQDVEELANYLMKNNSAWELAYSLADLMVQVESSAPRKIVVTKEEMNAITSLFRIRGYDEDGNRITKGRKRKDSKMGDV